MSRDAVAVLLAYSIMEIAPRSPPLISLIYPSPTHPLTPMMLMIVMMMLQNEMDP